MDLNLERESSILGSLFQQIINDMKNTSPLWEDFVGKTGKLHTCLKASIQAIAAYLDAFQKIADAATNSKGASKEIGTALTRVCLRHKAVEMRLKTFTTAIMDCLVQPLQDKIEDWKRAVATIDKEHAKEYKRCRTELKKRSNDTLRLQKKARKGQVDTIQTLVDSHLHDVTVRRAELEEVEKRALRAVMIEERMRYCTFVNLLQPVVKEECEVLSELGHLQEAMDSISLVTKEPHILPQASEELIHDAKLSMPLYPESPGNLSIMQLSSCTNSLGSRKNSMCSISSINSSGSSNSPGHHNYQHTLSQFVEPTIRLKPGESNDSGFCSSSALTNMKTPTATNQLNAASTWTQHSQDDDDSLLSPSTDRPHTISTTYEKGHQRPPLTVYTFQNPDTIHEAIIQTDTSPPNHSTPLNQKLPAAGNISNISRPPLPVRCSSLERSLPASNQNRGNASNILQRQCPSPIPARITKELSAHHQQQQQQQHQLNQNLQQTLQAPPPTYVNMSDLANMAATKVSNQQKTTEASLCQQLSADSISSYHSNESTGSNSSTQQSQNTLEQKLHMNNSSSIAQNSNSTRSHSLCSSGSSNTTYESADAGQIPTPSSGSSTPQNNYSLLLTNSPTSTPSLASMGSNNASNEAVESPLEQSGIPILTSYLLKITESTAANNNIENTAIAGSSGSSSKVPAANTADTNVDVDITSLESPTIVENEDRLRASVLQKASMFEKQAAAASQTPTLSNAVRAQPTAEGVGSNIYNTNTATHYNTRLSDERRSPATATNQNEVGGGGSSRIARRSSVNAARPPPPVRRSSSVTPNPNGAINPQNGSYTSNLIQQQQNNMTQSNESLPPPPPYLLAGGSCSTHSPIAPPTVYESVRAPEEIRYHPSLLMQQYNSHQNIYAQYENNYAAYTYQPYSEINPNPNPQNSCTIPQCIGFVPQDQQYLPHSYQISSSTLGVLNSSTLPPLPPQSTLPAPTAPTAPKVNSNTPNCSSWQLQSQFHQQYSPQTTDRLFTHTELPVLRQQQQQQPQQQHQQQSPNKLPLVISNSTSYRSSTAATTTGGGIYAQPKVANMSSFRNTSPSPNGYGYGHQPSSPQPKANANLIAQLNARLGSKQQQQQHQIQQEQEGSCDTATQLNQNKNAGSMVATYGQQQQHQQQHHHQQQQQHQQQQNKTDDHADKSGSGGVGGGSIRSKSNAEFLENLNAKLAKQGMSGRAFAVRNLINSKAMPDPRICHESLMDQIKRGATLKRNQKINDRSAPKIY